jgi:hypothetical protein
MTAGFFFPYRAIQPNRNANPNWCAPKLEKRFVADSTTVPASYDPSSHEVDCIIATSTRVRRLFGFEVLSITKDAVDLNRLRRDRGGIPLLDSHSIASVFHTVGRLTSAWIEDQKPYGTLRFARTPEGQKAEAMVSRGELRTVSPACTVQEWSAEDEDGEEIEIVNPDWSHWASGDTVYVARRWQLTEVSLTTIPCDPAALIL